MKNKVIIKMVVFTLATILGLVGGSVGAIVLNMPYTEVLEKGNEIYYSLNDKTQTTLANNVTSGAGSVSVHFLELGNKYTGDCTYIKIGEDIDILIDCGSRSNSISYVKSYLDNYVTDGILDYVIITHAHQDHYAGFATSSKIDSIFDLFYCKTIITFSQTTTGKTDTSTYKNFTRELNEAKADINTKSTVYTALECVENQNGASSNFILDQENNIYLQILDSPFYYTADSNENNHSVCCMINQGDKNFLFTGDLEGEGELELIARNSLPKVELLKAGHHGSKTSSYDAFLNTVLDPTHPAIICVCCCAGSSEYTATIENQFPTKEFIARISHYTTLVYITTMCIDYKNNKFCSFNGSIVVSSKASETLVVDCSSNNTILKDTQWFKDNRYEMCKNVMAESWK